MSKAKKSEDNTFEELETLEHYVKLVRIESSFQKYQINNSKPETSNLSFKSGKQTLTPLMKQSAAIPETGLTIDEIKTIFPSLLTIDATDRSFLPEVWKFYSTLKVDVPIDGVIFNIAKINGVPVVPVDYIKYKFICVYKKVAKPGEPTNPMVHKFVIIDANTSDKQKEANLKLKERAYSAYMSLDDRYIDIFNILMGYKNVESMKLIDKKENIQTLMNTDPARFLKILEGLGTNENPGIYWYKYIIAEYVNYNILRLSGNIYHKDTEILGTEAQLIAWMKDQKNAVQKVEMEAKLQSLKKIS